MPFFEGAIGVNASHGIFNDITGSQYNNWNTHDTHNTNSGNTTNKIFQDSYNTDSYNKSFNRGGSYAGQLYLNSTRNTNSASQVTPVLSQGDITPLPPSIRSRSPSGNGYPSAVSSPPRVIQQNRSWPPDEHPDESKVKEKRLLQTRFFKILLCR